MKKLSLIIYLCIMNFFNNLLHPDSNILGKQLCNTVNTNQFTQTRSVGDLDLTTNPNPGVLTCLYNPSGSGGDIIPGEGLILKDLGASDKNGIIPVVDIRGADANAIEGVLIFDQKKATKEIGDIITIARRDAVIIMEASETITRGAKVALVLASPGQVSILASEALFGKTLDKAIAIGDLIRVQVLAEGVV